MTAVPAYVYQPQTKRQRIEAIVASLKQELQSFLPTLRDLADYIIPRRARFQRNDINKGDRRSQKIVDSTASQSSRTLGAGMHSGVTSPARPWLRLTVADPDLAELASVKAWLHTVTLRMLAVFARCNLYQVLPSFYEELGVFATAAMIVLKDPVTTIRCYPCPVGSYYIGVDARGEVNIFARVFQMKVRQLVEKFGGDDPRKPDLSKFSTRVRTAIQNRKLDEEYIEVVHVIMPNDDYDGVNLRSEYKRYYECYYEPSGGWDKQGEQPMLQEKGYDDFPVLVARWSVTGEDAYGTSSPGWVALGDIKMLQLMEKRSAQALDKLVNPPMKGPPELMTRKVSTLPGEMNYVTEREGQRGFTPVYEVKPDFQAIEFKAGRVQRRVQEAFYEDLFKMLALAPGMEKTGRTATEIIERKEEKLVAIGPVLEQVHTGVLKPLVDLTFAAMWEAGMIPPPPPELEGQEIKPEFTSIMAQAQKMIGMAGLERHLSMAIQVAAAFPNDPSKLDKLDFDQFWDETADSLGLPPRVIVPDDEVDAMRQARQAAQEAAQRTQLLNEASQAARNLSQSDTSGKNALTDMMAEAGAGAGGLLS